MYSSVISITKEQLAVLPRQEYTGKVCIVDTLGGVRPAVAALRKHPVVGFDTETRPSFKRGSLHKTALVQLATPRECFLFRVCRIGVPKPLKDYLEDGSRLKVGLSIHDDFNVLRRITPVEPAGFVELQELVTRYGITDISLQKIYAILFGKRISKNQQLTNWEAADLKPGQREYAALDAKACIDIYEYLTAGLFHPEESPYRCDIQPETELTDTCDE